MSDEDDGGGAVLRRRVIRRPDGTEIIETEYPLAALWTAPMTAEQLSRAFGMHRATLAERIAAGDIAAKPCGSLRRVRLDDAPPSLLGLGA